MPVHLIKNIAEFNRVCDLYNGAYKIWLNNALTKLRSRTDSVTTGEFLSSWMLKLDIHEPRVYLTVVFGCQGRVRYTKFVYRGFSLGNHFKIIELLDWYHDWTIKQFQHESWRRPSDLLYLDFNTNTFVLRFNRDASPTVKLPVGPAAKKTLFRYLGFIYSFINFALKNLKSAKYYPLSRRKCREVTTVFPKLRSDYNKLLKWYNLHSLSHSIIWDLVNIIDNYSEIFVLLHCAVLYVQDFCFEDVRSQVTSLTQSIHNYPSIFKVLKHRYLKMYTNAKESLK